MNVAGFPRASLSNLLTTSPVVAIGLEGAAGAMKTAQVIASATGTAGLSTLASAVMCFGGATYTHCLSASAGNGNGGDKILGVGLLGFGGASFAEISRNSALRLSGTTQETCLMVASPGEWAATHTPAAATQATATKAAGGAGVRHICRSITAAFSVPIAGTLTGFISVNLRDGASGAGTILRSWILDPTGIVATGVGAAYFEATDLNIIGSANTAMTLEFSAAGDANTHESVSMSGYSSV